MFRDQFGRVRSGSRTGRSPFVAACALAGLSLASVASAAAVYSITGLTLGDRALYPANNSSAGHVVGLISALPSEQAATYHAFVRPPTGAAVEIPTLAGAGAAGAGVTAYAFGVNATGDVVGTSQIALHGAPHAFLYKNGVTTDLAPFLDDDYCQAYAINNGGSIVGTYLDANFGNAYVLKPGGPTGYTRIDLGPGFAYSISESGYVVGETVDEGNNSVPFVFRDANNDGIVNVGEYSKLGTLGGNSANIALDVNDSGTIVGQSRDVNGLVHAVIWTSTAEGAVPQDLGNLGNGNSYAQSINNSGLVVGYSAGIAFLYQNNQLKRLDSLIPTEPRSTFPTWQLYLASGINNSGEIVGQGIANNTFSMAGFLLKSGGVVPPVSDVKLASFTATPGTITLGSRPVSVTFALGLTAKTKAAIKVPLVVKLNGETQLGFPVSIGKNKSAGTSVLQFDQDWTPGTYSITASYGGVDKTATLVINAAAPITLKTLTFPAKVKRGKKVNASLSLTDVPAGTAEVKLVLLDATQTPISLLGIPVEYTLTLVRKDTATAKVTIPTLLPAGTYYVRAAYGGVTKTVMFQAQ